MTALFVILTYLSIGVGVALLNNWLDIRHPDLMLGRIENGGELLGTVLGWPILSVAFVVFCLMDILDKPVKRINEKMEKDVKR